MIFSRRRLYNFTSILFTTYKNVFTCVNLKYILNHLCIFTVTLQYLISQLIKFCFSLINSYKPIQ